LIYSFRMTSGLGYTVAKSVSFYGCVIRLTYAILNSEFIRDEVSAVEQIIRCVQNDKRFGLYGSEKRIVLRLRYTAHLCHTEF
jgi:hypothetical protein